MATIPPPSFLSNSTIATIVGYAQSGLRENGTLVVPQFIPVANTEIPLDTLVATGDDVNDVQVQTLDEYGRTVDSYTWNDYMYDNACWVNDDMEEVTGVSFPAGQGFFVLGSSTSQALQSAGKVGTSDITVRLRENATLTGNPFPVSVALQDIVATGDDVNSVQIQTLDEYGRTVDSYTWNDYMYDDACWVNDDMEEVTGITFAPGQGLFVLGSTTEQFLRFPAPEL